MNIKNYYLDAIGIQRWRAKGTVKFETFALLDVRDEQVRGVLLLESGVDCQQIEVENLLNAMLLAIGLKRGMVSTSVGKLQIVMGERLAQTVLNTGLSFETLREGNFKRIEGNSPILVTYHPKMLLSDPGLKRKAWEDLKLLQRST